MSKRILFTSWTSRSERPYYDPSVRYRCYNFAQELSRRGCSASVMPQTVFQRNQADLARYDIYVFHRPHLTEELAAFLLGKGQESVVIADFDDFIFDVRFAHLTPQVRVRGAALAGVQSYLSKNYDAASLIANHSTSTEPLKQHIDTLLPEQKATVIHNFADPGFIGLSRAARRLNPFNKRRYALGYFSGTATHDLDLEMISKPIRGYLKDSGQHLLLAGPVKIPTTLLDVADQITTHPLVSFHELPNLMAQCSTVLAPLENTVFTRSKSGLKFFEAALAGCDVIATPIPDIHRFNSPLLQKCVTVEDWERALVRRPITNSDERELHVKEIETLVGPAQHIDAWLKTFGSL